ncbi:VOC family protein [Amycolatopsis sp. A1MSW2902]|uniref:VOC family protein n=1 Tax=Amycolatopsis sp. A1MSW2902 TaxID=687413 RepID=UPI00307EBEB3
MDMTLQLTIDCSGPQKMVAFWAEALGYVLEPPPAGHATWRAHWAAWGARRRTSARRRGCPGVDRRSLGTGPQVWFQEVPEPKAAKNRWHFDLKVGGGRDVPLDGRAQRVKATADRLVEAGAAVLRIKDEPDHGLYAAAMRDPEGNEFDIV